jgi:hypothetical protein
MNSSSPWWSTPVFTLGGVLLTLLVTVWLDHRRGRRESRHRWTEHKMALYSEFLDACDDLRDISVWPADRAGEPAATLPPLTRIRRVTRRATYPAPGPVRVSLTGVVHAARKLATTIDELRATTKPGHAGALDDRVRPRLEAALSAFDKQVDAFIAASRTDIDITDPVDSPTP